MGSSQASSETDEVTQHRVYGALGVVESFFASRRPLNETSLASSTHIGPATKPITLNTTYTKTWGALWLVHMHPPTRLVSTLSIHYNLLKLLMMHPNRPALEKPSVAASKDSHQNVPPSITIWELVDSGDGNGSVSDLQTGFDARSLFFINFCNVRGLDSNFHFV